MAVLSDILALLDRWPRWKAITTTPDRIDALEKRVAALEAKALPAPKVIQPGRECPICGAEMKVISEQPDPVLGPVGVKAHVLACTECKTETTRQYSARKGYL